MQENLKMKRGREILENLPGRWYNGRKTNQGRQRAEKMNYGVILAAGSGSRMHSTLPKQFLELDGEPILVKSLRHFVTCSKIDRIIIAVPSAYLDFTRELLEKFFPKNNFLLISGGENRSETLVRLTDFIFENLPIDEKTVLVTHDAVRPYISERIILDNIEAALSCGACNTVVPAVDTILISEDGTYISEVPDRKKCYHAQTPQSFLAKELKFLLDSMDENSLSGLTDGCSVFVLNHRPVKLVAGSHENIKITYPSDLL